MGKSLLHLGFVVLAGAVWLFLGGQIGWLDPATADRFGPAALKASLGCLLAGVLMLVISPMERKLRGARCARCGHPTAPGHLYCLDHAKTAMDELRDLTRDGRPRGRGTR